MNEIACKEQKEKDNYAEIWTKRKRETDV